MAAVNLDRANYRYTATKARKGINPFTGEETTFKAKPAHNVVKVRALKNLKGLIDQKSRKACHSNDPEKDLHFWVARLADKMPPIFTLIDGIYTSEYGPNVDGRKKHYISNRL